jgi:hypothetical protein
LSTSLQKKRFINRGDVRYLREEADGEPGAGEQIASTASFSDALFFEGLAKPEHERTPAVAQRMLGQVCYLNGGLFLKHSD